MLKRAIDFLVSALVLWVSIPFMLILALLIKLDSPGPVFIIQERVGYKGRVFKCYKLRTMRVDAEKEGIQLSPGASDTRVTRVGWILRIMHIDELPQVINIFVGEMSWVGPRPERPFFHSQFSRQLKQWPLRCETKPGLAGIAQVRGYTSNEMEDKLQSDLEYIKTRSLWMDFSLFVQCVWIGATNLFYNR